MNKSNHLAFSGYKYSIRDKHHIDSPPYFLPVYYRPQDQANWSVVGDDCRIPGSIFSPACNDLYGIQTWQQKQTSFVFGVRV